MKRRLLSAFLAVMMVLTMAPVAFAADTATSDGEALSKLFTDVHAGESGSGNVTVTIDKDYDLTGYQLDIAYCSRLHMVQVLLL